MRHTAIRSALLQVLAAMSLTSQTPNYEAAKISVDGFDVARLADRERRIEVLIAPGEGNNAYRMAVNGRPVLWAPAETPAGLKTARSMGGNPFLAPWANRLDGEAYYANGLRYLLNPHLGNYRKDPNGLPIHGLLVHAGEWEVMRLAASEDGAAVTSRLEFWRYPRWMAQFPFAHTIEMTYRLAGGELEVETVIENLSTEPMPLSIGYHTYYQITDAPRDEWKIRLAARERLLLSDKVTPTGETVPVDDQGPLVLGETRLDDLFAGLVRDPQGRAVFSLEGVRQKIAIAFGPKYTIAVVWAPPGREFICFEPMTGPTNVFNLAHSGAWNELQQIPPGASWRESFWIRPSGY